MFYVPAVWTVYNGSFFKNIECNESVGEFVSYYCTEYSAKKLIGNGCKILSEEKSVINNINVEKFLVKCDSNADSDNGEYYELNYFIISNSASSSGNKLVDRLIFKSAIISKKVLNEDAILKTIYDNTGLDEEKINEILHSVTETENVQKNSSTIPVNFNSQIVTQMADGHTYAICIPAKWTYYNGEFFADKKYTKSIGNFELVAYNESQPIAGYLGAGTNFKILYEDDNMRGIKNQIAKVLVKRENSSSLRAQGDKSVYYELDFFIISKNKKIANELSLYSNKINETISDKDSILKTIYDNNGLNEEKINEILQSYEETAN